MPLNYIELHDKIEDWSNTHKKWLEEFQLLNREESIKYDSSLPIYQEKLKEELRR